MTDNRFSRRGFLELGAAAAATVVVVQAGSAEAKLGSRSPPLALREQCDVRFPLGVASGDVTSSTVVLWTRAALATPLRCTVWSVDANEALVEVASVDAVPADGGTVHVEVTGLVPSTAHRFVFFDSLGTRSPTGCFATAPPDDALVPLVFGATACTKNGKGFGVIGAAARRTDLSFFVHLGDTVYADGSLTLPDYRASWTQNLSTADYRALRSSMSVFATWDDHEVQNNWDAESIDPAQASCARQAFFEHQPLQQVGVVPGRIWKKKRWGKTAELFILDGRGERRSSAGHEQYISREQMDWLKAGLLASAAVFKIIVNSAPIMKTPFFFGLSRGEQWTSHPTQRDEILGFIDGNHIRGVLWVSGDFHLGVVGRVSGSGYGANAYEVLCGPGAQTPNPLGFLMRGSQFDWVSGENNYGAIHLDPQTGIARVVHHDIDDTVIADHSLQLA